MKSSFYLLVALIALGACKKPGCTDPDAVNYNSDAKTNDGSCSFEGSNVFWYDEETAGILVDDGAITLFYYVDGELIGSAAASVYWTSDPDCLQAGSITLVKDLGSVKTQSVNYRVQDESDWIYWEGVLNVNANTCTNVELTF